MRELIFIFLALSFAFAKTANITTTQITTTQISTTQNTTTQNVADAINDQQCKY